MINEIYIDNFRCLNNFQIKPEGFQLLLGDNGSGKTSVLDAIRCIQRLMRNDHVENIFKKNSLTVWDKRLTQTIGLSLTIDNEKYKYELQIEYTNQDDKQRIKREELKWKDSTFYLFDGHEAHLFRINWKTDQIEEGAVFSADWGRSIIPTLASREDNRPLIRFRDELEKILILNPIPFIVESATNSESRVLSDHAENFAQWYRYLLQEHPVIGYRAKELLMNALPDFEQLSLKEIGQSRKLVTTFRMTNKDYDFDFVNLSSGQQQLIILYTVLEALREGAFSTIFNDEPDNFISLREIQPWLESVKSICDEHDKQAIIISHHPEIINKMVHGNELLFSRNQTDSHVVVRSFPKSEHLLPAEMIARGWENE